MQLLSYPEEKIKVVVKETIVEKYPGCVATIGNMVFSPGAFNIIPEHITVFLEFRSENDNFLDQMEETFLNNAEKLSQKNNLNLQIQKCENVHPINMSHHFQKTIEEVCNLLHLKSVSVPSGAGHDAQSLAQICSSGMIFIPSIGGHSHSAREFSYWKDCVHGANVLLQTTLTLNKEKN